VCPVVEEDPVVPVYQYACTECGEQLEVRQSFTDDALTVCPVCEGRLRKVLTAVGVVFKGSGFYRNDSRAAASGNDSGATSTTAEKSNGEASKPAAAKADATSGDSKPAASAGDSGKKKDGGGKGPVAGSKPAAAAAR
jgi:putative FmdB family regulatory protein